MKTALVSFATRRPRVVFWVTALLTLGAAALLPLIDIDTDPENMLSPEQPDRVFHDEIRQRFTLHDAIVVGIVNDSNPDGIYNPQSLAALHQLSAAILDIDGVIKPDLMSLSQADNITQGGAGEIRFEWMMKEAPTTAMQAASIRDAVQRLPLLQNTLVAGDGKAAAIYVPIASKDLSYPISVEIQRLAAALGSGAGEFHITGLPVAEDTFGVEMFVQMGISAPLAGLMIFLLMWYFFRSWKLIVAPMLVAMATVIIVMGLLIGMGFTVHIMSSMIPIFLMPIAVVDSVHIMSEFADRYDPERGAATVIRDVVGHLFTPMLFTSLTSAVGFLSLMLTPIPPVQIFGAYVAFGILLAFVLTVLFIPAYVVCMAPASLASLPRHSAADAPSHSPLARALRVAGRFAFGNSKLIVGATVVLMAVSVAGVLQIQINDNPVRWFKDQHRIRVADAVLNQHFAGTYDAFLVLEYDDAAAYSQLRDQAAAELDALTAAGFAVTELRERLGAVDSDQGLADLISYLDDELFAADDAAVAPLEELLSLTETAQSEARYFQRPDALAVIGSLQAALQSTGWVGKSNALPDVVKVVNRELRGGNPDDYVIPGSVAGVAQTLLQYQSSHRPQDLWHMVTPDFRSSAIWLQLTSGDNQDMSRVIAAVDDYLAANPLPDGVEARWAGKTFINVVWQTAMVQGMVWSLVGAFAAVFVMMSMLFRSVRFGLIAMLPLSVTILGVYGLIGWIGKDYDMPIAVLSSLTLGLSVDFAIHFIQRMRELTRETGSFATAAERMFEEPARAIARNAIVIALGFTPLFFAPLVPYITVGAFMASIMAISGAATLLLLPAVLSWFMPAASRTTEEN